MAFVTLKIIEPALGCCVVNWGVPPVIGKYQKNVYKSISWWLRRELNPLL